jgi:hypothetical protein
LRALVFLALAGCGGRAFPSEADCAALKSDPGGALERLGPKAGTPAKFWGAVETCWAPDGDACERARVGVESMPSMAEPTAAQRSEYARQYVEACRRLAPAQQQCLVISYAIDHAAECEASGARAAMDAMMR